MHLTQNPTAVPHYGVFELKLEADTGDTHPIFGVDFAVAFTRPNGSVAKTEGFFDGAFFARAYADTPGTWQWRAISSLPELNGQTGSFAVVPSNLKGQLRRHREDPHQFTYDNGDWFLHIGDTGYRYVTDAEPEWQAYIDQAAAAGFTKIRTWFCRGRSDVQALFDPQRQTLNLPYWREIDRRLVYALNRHPQVMFKLIPYGEDTEELRRYGEDALSAWIARYAQARFSALPNIFWCVSNDREIIPNDEPLTGRKVHAATIDRIARDMAARDPWEKLLTNHQCRFKGYSFVDAAWSDIVTLEDIDQVHGQLILDYRARASVPVINDEDRYEHYREPKHPRYFFRRLMWASLLSGGHATYGGLRTFEPYDADAKGVYGYFDGARSGKLTGAHDFRHIHAFFTDTGLTLVNFEPDDACVGDNPYRWKCAHTTNTFIAYLANPSGDQPETDDASEQPPTVNIRLPSGIFAAHWFCPADGQWHAQADVPGGGQSLTAPGPGDWVLWLERL